jgi:regulator of ribonuclease activity A
MTFTTADLYDQLGDKLQVATPMFNDYGFIKKFAGPISTIKAHEDNVLVRSALEEPGEGRVLVIDGGGSLRCAMVGDMLAEIAVKNGWQGILVNGCIRDAVMMSRMDLGIKALNTNPRKSVKKGAGDRDIPVTFAGVNFVPGHYLYADEDGVVVSESKVV